MHWGFVYFRGLGHASNLYCTDRKAKKISILVKAKILIAITFIRELEKCQIV